MKKLLSLVLCAAALGIYSCRAADAANTRPVVKIGLLLSLTGDLATFGESYRNAIMMAQDDKPNTKYRYELIYEDCEYSAAKTTTAVQKLINVDKVDCIITFFDLFAKITAPLAERHKIVQLAYAMDHESAKGLYNFLHEESAEDEAVVFCEGLKKRNLKKVAIFTVKDPYSQFQYKALMPLLKKYGIEVVADFVFNPSERDFRTLVAKCRAAKPDIYCLLTFTPTLEILTRQLREAGETAFSGLETHENTSEYSLFEGLWYVAPVNPKGNFMKRYKDRFKSQVQLGTGHAYDMYNMMVSAYESFDGKTKPASEQVANYLAGLKHYEGITGIAVNNAEGEFRNPPCEKIIKNGEPADLP